MTEHGGADQPRDDLDRHAAQEAAAELARMGIEPVAFGLDPAQPGAVGPRPPAARLLRGPGASPEWAPAPPPGHGGWPDRQDRPQVGALARPVGAPDEPAGAPAPGHDQAANQAATQAATEAVTATPVAERAGTPGAWRYGLRAAGSGLLRPGTAAAVEREQQLVARIRARQRQARTIAFVAGKGGVGTTTTAAAVALTLDALRYDATALVDTRHGVGSVGRWLSGQAAPTPVDLLTRRTGQPPPQPLRVGASLGVVDGMPWFDAPAADTLGRVLTQLAERYLFTILDVGTDAVGTGEYALRRADQIVVVTTPGASAAASLSTMLGRVYKLDPDLLATLVVAVVDTRPRRRWRPAGSPPGGEQVPVQRVVRVPFDPRLAAEQRWDMARLRPATREAYLRIAAWLTDPGQPDTVLRRRVGVDTTRQLFTARGPDAPSVPGRR